MPFPLRACFLLPLAALLCMAVRLPAQAVRRACDAGRFPPPPSSGYTELELVFTSDETVKD
ncbi:hypothetical protein [Desulfovibrio sp. ZJ200]|uniref:hypothetical protein n=1 Tax=Desulfovibrio sp. ZJ200 TaxID=2709792 RepID=UPI0013EAC661|nr:hypothetical protein [Desulfovibrio sp. ZJ200]